MKKYFLILALLLPTLLFGQITNSQVKTRIDQKVNLQLRAPDVREVLKLISDYARQADSTANTKIGQAAIVTERSAAATYQNKVLNGALNTFQNIPVTGIAGLGNTLDGINAAIISLQTGQSATNSTVGSLTAVVNTKQANLVSAVNIRPLVVNGTTNSLLGSAPLTITAGNPRAVGYYTQANVRAGVIDTVSLITVLNPKNGIAFDYKYDATDLASADDSAFVLRFGNKRYKINTTFYTPKMAGAIGDGVADDTQPMRKWIAKAGALEMDPNSVYYIKGTLTSRKQVVSINGRNSRIKVDSSVVVTSTNGVIRIGKAQNVELRNFQLDHVRYLAQSTWHTKSITGIRIDSSDRVLVENVIITKSPHYALFINRSPEVTVKNVKVLGFYRGGIQVEYGSSNVMLDDVKIYGTGDSLGVNVTGNSIPNGMGEDLTGIGLQVLQSESVVIRNAKINDALDHGIRVESSRAILIDGCTVTGSGADGIRINGRGTSPSTRRFLNNVRIVNNVIQNNVYRHPGGTALLLVQDTQNGLIANNVFGDTTKVGGVLNGLRLTNFLGWNDNVLIQNNVFNEIRSGNECVNAFGGSANTKNITLEGNTINGKVILKSWYGKTLLKNNKIRYYGGGNTIDLDQNADTEVTENTIIAPTGAGVRYNVSDIYPTKILGLNNNIEVGLRAIYTVTTSLDTLYDRTIELSGNRVYSTKWLDRQNLPIRTVKDEEIYVNRAFDIGTFSDSKFNRNVIRGFEDGIVVAGTMKVGNQLPSMQFIGNDLGSMRYRGISIITSGPTAKTVKNLDIIDNKFYDCAKDSTSNPISVAINNLVTYSYVRVVGNDFVLTNSRQGFAFAGTTGLKVPFLILRDNVLDVSAIADPANLVTYVSNLRGYTYINSNYNPPSISAGAIHSTTIAYPVEVAQGRSTLSVRSGHNLAGEILFTGQITGDNEITLYFRNLSASPVDLPGASVNVRID